MLSEPTELSATPKLMATAPAGTGGVVHVAGVHDEAVVMFGPEPQGLHFPAEVSYHAVKAVGAVDWYDNPSTYSWPGVTTGAQATPGCATINAAAPLVNEVMVMVSASPPAGPFAVVVNDAAFSPLSLAPQHVGMPPEDCSNNGFCNVVGAETAPSVPRE